MGQNDNSKTNGMLANEIVKFAINGLCTPFTIHVWYYLGFAIYLIKYGYNNLLKNYPLKGLKAKYQFAFLNQIIHELDTHGLFGTCIVTENLPTNAKIFKYENLF